MNADKLKTLLEDIRGGRITVDEGMTLLKDLPIWISDVQSWIRTGNCGSAIRR